MSKQYIEFKFVEVSYASALVIRSMMISPTINLKVHHKYLELSGTIEREQMYELIQCIKYDCNRYQLYYQHDGSDSGIEEIFDGDTHSTLTMCDGNYMMELSRVVQKLRDGHANDLYDLHELIKRGLDKLFDSDLSFSYEFVDIFKRYTFVTFYDENDDEIE